jgi:starch phosphorylase
MRETIFTDFARIFPDRFVNVTNGITPRRWLNQANPGLARLIDLRIGSEWRADLDRLSALRPLADDAEFAAAFAAVKAENKRRLAAMIFRKTGIEVNPESLFDVQIKRIHEYKRQLLNVLHVIHRYNRMRAEPHLPWVPRTVIFAGKAASAYWMAKLIIRLINDVAERVNIDPATRDRLKVVFIPNYGVSVAEATVPAADLSEQISTAGTEASGTGNMKLALNGALTIGTEDGANIEIRDHVGAENIFIFGLTAEQVRRRRADGHDPRAILAADPALAEIIGQIGAGYFSPGEPDRYRGIVDALIQHGDHYLLLADFAAYRDAQGRVDARYRDPARWRRSAIINVAGMGPFSSDRAIAEYAESIWRVKPL